MADVMEKHGVVQNEAGVALNERDQCIAMTTSDNFAGRTVFLSPNEARHVAAKLYRLARRVEARLP